MPRQNVEPCGPSGGSISSQERENTVESCMAWVAGSGERAVLLLKSRWQKGDVISVEFMDGDPGLQQKVQEVARRWVRPDGPARLGLSFRPPGSGSLIRISFQYSGSWSAIGSSCRSVSLQWPTMNFGWLTPQSSDTEIRRVVLHEFGHALGLCHEHQHPESGIEWDREAIYADLMRGPWTKEDIDKNVLVPLTQGETRYSVFDPTSIMLYPIKKSWTRGGVSYGLNTDLSETDRQFVRQSYP